MAFKKYTVGSSSMILENYICACFSDRHLLQVSYDIIDGEVMLTVKLTRPYSLFKRLKNAVKHLLNMDSDWQYDSFIFKPEDAKNLKNILELYLRNQDSSPDYFIKNAENWKEMAGDNDIEKKVNSYLTGQFTVKKDVPKDECLREAKEVIRIIKGD